MRPAVANVNGNRPAVAIIFAGCGSSKALRGAPGAAKDSLLTLRPSAAYSRAMATRKKKVHLEAIEPSRGPGRPTTFPPGWLALAEGYGGIEALAGRLGTTYRTIQRWAHGERTPTGPALMLIEQLARRKALAMPEIAGE